jgi:hypothetical protein
MALSQIGPNLFCDWKNITSAFMTGNGMFTINTADGKTFHCFGDEAIATKSSFEAHCAGQGTRRICTPEIERWRVMAGVGGSISGKSAARVVV